VPLPTPVVPLPTLWCHSLRCGATPYAVVPLPTPVVPLPTPVVPLPTPVVPLPTLWCHSLRCGATPYACGATPYAVVPLPTLWCHSPTLWCHSLRCGATPYACDRCNLSDLSCRILRFLHRFSIIFVTFYWIPIYSFPLSLYFTALHMPHSIKNCSTFP
jgi:hypothetical protein